MNNIDWTLAALDYTNYVQSMSYSDKNTENVRTNLSNLPIIGGAHLQYVHKHCAKFKFYWLNMVRDLDYTN
jgi:hypothetical protein